LDDPPVEAQEVLGGGEGPDRPEGLRGETGIAALCRRESIPRTCTIIWSKDPLEAEKQQLVETANARLTACR